GYRPVARECTYQDFMKCQPLNFKGTEVVVTLIRWFEKMETVFHINNCLEKYQVKYATYTLLNSALTWWNSHKRNIRTEVAFAMSWKELMKLMAEVYRLRNYEIQKMESELWNLTVKNNDLTAYTQRFQELTMMCTKMVLEEEDQIEKFIGGLLDNIQGNVIAAEPTRLQDAVWIANNLMDQKLKGYAMKNAENKKMLERKPYNGSLPLRNKCKIHHELPCTVRCEKCNKIGHLTRDCKVTNSTTSTQRGQIVNQRVVTCFECGRQGHYRSDYPMLKDQNHRNKVGNKNGVREARGKALPVARECTYQDFMKCQPLNFKGTEVVVTLIRWFEKMETVFHINNCLEKYQVKYATYTLLNSALTWWNSHKRNIRTEVAFAMSWKELMKLMAEVYRLRNYEIQKMESELWNLTVKNNDLTAYTQRFQELTMMCTKMVLEEEDQIEKFIGGLLDNIQGNVIAAEPTRLQDAVWIANNLMDQKLKGYAMKNAENKKMLEVNQRDNRG
nr:hypothetical protein [Tanacetum cinerariifolium]